MCPFATFEGPTKNFVPPICTFSSKHSIVAKIGIHANCVSRMNLSTSAFDFQHIYCFVAL